jgi:hypothetical protein
VVDRLCTATQVHEHEAIGVLVTFWSGVAEHATNGQIAAASDAQLEKWAKWRRKRGAFAAWVRAEHQDAHGRVPEWDDYAGELEYQRARNRAHQKAYRDRQQERIQDLHKPNGNEGVSLTSPTTVRYGTKRDGTEEQETVKRALPSRVARKPRATTGEEPTWVQALTTAWLATIGAVTHGRLGKALAPVVALYGEAAVLAALDVYASDDEGPRHGRRVEYFAAEFTKWHTLASTPLVDPGGVLTTRGARVGLTP